MRALPSEASALRRRWTARAANCRALRRTGLDRLEVELVARFGGYEAGDFGV